MGAAAKYGYPRATGDSWVGQSAYNRNSEGSFVGQVQSHSQGDKLTFTIERANEQPRQSLAKRNQLIL